MQSDCYFYRTAENTVFFVLFFLLKPVFLFLYPQPFLQLSLSPALSLSVTNNPTLVACSAYWGNIRQTQLNSQSGKQC